MNELNDYDLHKAYDEALDEMHGMAKIGGYEYATSRALKEVDPTAYRCGFNDWLDGMINDELIIEKDDKYYVEDFQHLKED